MHKRHFTLLEILAALAFSAILFAALVSVFHMAFKFRETSEDRHAVTLANRRARRQIQHDLMGIAAPNTTLPHTLSAPMVGTAAAEQGVRHDTLKFATTSGMVHLQEPGYDLLHVTYELRDSDKNVDQANTTAQAPGYELIRSVQTNLPSVDIQDPAKTTLLERVSSFELTYYNGIDWQDNWNSSSQNSKLPTAVRMLVERLPDERGIVPRPLELVIPITVERQQGYQ